MILLGESRPAFEVLVRAALVAVVAAALLAALPVAPAGAHAVLQRTEPADGETLPEAPAEVVLTFSEPVTAQLGGIRVLDGDGRQVDEGDAGGVPDQPAQERVGLPEDLPDGSYVVSWSAVSADGHPINGAFLFGVGAGGAAPDERALRALQDASTATDAGFTVLADALRVFMYLGALLAVGAVLFLLRVSDGGGSELPAILRVGRWAAGVGAAATLLAVPVQAALITGLGARALADPAVIREILVTGYGWSASLRAAGLAAVAVALPRVRAGAFTALGLAGVVAVTGSWLLTGHAASAEPRWLFLLSDVVHTLAGAAWFGGLVLLVLTLRGRRRDGDAAGAAGAVARFSALATVAVIAVGVAGTALAVMQVRTPRALVESAYGWTLIAKVALVAVVAAMGAYNNRRLVPAVTGRRPPSGRGGARPVPAADAAPAASTPSPGTTLTRPAPARVKARRPVSAAWAALFRTVRLEAAGLAVVVAITGVFTTLVPARTAAGVDGPYSEYAALGEYQLNVTIDPNRVGTNELHFYLLGADGRLTDDVSEITVGLTMPSAAIGAFELEPEFVTPGHWTTTADELTLPGEWQVEVSARVSEFEQADTTLPVRVNP